MFQLHIIFACLVLGLIVLGFSLFFLVNKIQYNREVKEDYHHQSFSFRDYLSLSNNILFIFVSVMSLFVFLMFASILFPYNVKYWTVQDHSGVIERVDSRTTSNNETLISQFAFTFTDSDQVFLTDDARFLNIDEGDEINVKCSWEWIYAGEDKYNCTLD